MRSLRHRNFSSIHVQDLHAAILHLLGRATSGLSDRYTGRDFRLIDVKGSVVRDAGGVGFRLNPGCSLMRRCDSSTPAIDSAPEPHIIPDPIRS